MIERYSDDIFDSLLVKKYEPKNIDEMVLSDLIKAKVNEYIAAKEFPSLLFCGAPGQGKTTLAINLCKAVNATWIKVNASFDNGIDTIRGTINNFSQTMSLDGSIKAIILDEADRLSPQSQDALRGMIEDYASHTRFILTANELSRITPALQSRLTSLNILPPWDGFKSHICSILKSEKVKIEKAELPNLMALLKKYYPDLRRTIGIIQKNIVNGSLIINEKDIQDDFITKIYEGLTSKNPVDVRTLWIKNESEFQGDYPFLMKNLHEYVYNKNELAPATRANIILLIAEALVDSQNVIDQEINFYALILRIMKVLKQFT